MCQIISVTNSTTNLPKNIVDDPYLHIFKQTFLGMSSFITFIGT